MSNAEQDFLDELLKDEGTHAKPTAESRALEMMRKFNLPSRFTIQTQSPLSNFTGNFSKAFEVTDSKQKEDIYALIMPNNIPIRFNTIQQLKLSFHHNCANVVDAGFTDSAGSQFGSYAVIMEKPTGRKLSDYIKELKKQFDANGDRNSEVRQSLLHEDFIAEHIVAPLNEVLRTFAENNVSHGRINHDNVYLQNLVDPKIVLGECISEPCGYSQPYQYETIERAMAMPLGKGNSSIKNDYFSLGVMIYYIIFGDMPLPHHSLDEMLKSRISKGTYNSYIGATELSPTLTDIMRGLLTDNQNERWGYEQVLQWVKGKRFNLIRPGSRKEAVRHYEFAEILHSGKRLLALTYHQKWDEAAIDIRDKKLVKWLELSANDKATAAEIASIVSATGGEKTKSRSDNDELVAKALMILDNDAPIRYHDISVNLDGLGPVLANAWVHQTQSELAYFVDMIRMNLLDFKAVREADNEKVDRWTLQRQQAYIKYKSLGYGLERVLYDLNPTLPCQSPMLSQQFIIDISQLLLYLNDNAQRLITNDPVDRHIAAYIASKLELASEIKLKIQRRFVRNEMATTQLTKLALLAFAQRKTRVVKVPGLCNWVLEKLKPVTNSLHGEKLKKEFNDELKMVAAQGNIEALLQVVASSDYFARDDDGFAEAKARYNVLDGELKAIRAREKMSMKQDVYFQYGLQFAKVLASMVFIITLIMKVV